MCRIVFKYVFKYSICKCCCTLVSVLELERNLLELYKVTKLMHSLMTSVINTKQGKGSKELLTGALWFVINPQVV